MKTAVSQSSHLVRQHFSSWKATPPFISRLEIGLSLGHAVGMEHVHDMADLDRAVEAFLPQLPRAEAHHAAVDLRSAASQNAGKHGLFLQRAKRSPAKVVTKSSISPLFTQRCGYENPARTTAARFPPHFSDISSSGAGNLDLLAAHRADFLVKSPPFAAVLKPGTRDITR